MPNDPTLDTFSQDDQLDELQSRATPPARQTSPQAAPVELKPVRRAILDSVASPTSVRAKILDSYRKPKSTDKEFNLADVELPLDEEAPTTEEKPFNLADVELPLEGEATPEKSLSIGDYSEYYANSINNMMGDSISGIARIPRVGRDLLIDMTLGGMARAAELNGETEVANQLRSGKQKTKEFLDNYSPDLEGFGEALGKSIQDNAGGIASLVGATPNTAEENQAIGSSVPGKLLDLTASITTSLAMGGVGRMGKLAKGSKALAALPLIQGSALAAESARDEDISRGGTQAEADLMFSLMLPVAYASSQALGIIPALKTVGDDVVTRGGSFLDYAKNLFSVNILKKGVEEGAQEATEQSTQEAVFGLQGLSEGLMPALRNVGESYVLGMVGGLGATGALKAGEMTTNQNRYRRDKAEVEAALRAQGLAPDSPEYAFKLQSFSTGWADSATANLRAFEAMPDADKNSPEFVERAKREFDLIARKRLITAQAKEVAAAKGSSVLQTSGGTTPALAQEISRQAMSATDPDAISGYSDEELAQRIAQDDGSNPALSILLRDEQKERAATQTVSTSVDRPLSEFSDQQLEETKTQVEQAGESPEGAQMLSDLLQEQERRTQAAPVEVNPPQEVPTQDEPRETVSTESQVQPQGVEEAAQPQPEPAQPTVAQPTEQGVRTPVPPPADDIYTAPEPSDADLVRDFDIQKILTPEEQSELSTELEDINNLTRSEQQELLGELDAIQGEEEEVPAPVVGPKKKKAASKKVKVVKEVVERKKKRKAAMVSETPVDTPTLVNEGGFVREDQVTPEVRAEAYRAGADISLPDPITGTVEVTPAVAQEEEAPVAGSTPTPQEEAAPIKKRKGSERGVMRDENGRVMQKRAGRKAKPIPGFETLTDEEKTIFLQLQNSFVNKNGDFASEVDPTFSDPTLPILDQELLKVIHTARTTFTPDLVGKKGNPVSLREYVGNAWMKRQKTVSKRVNWVRGTEYVTPAAALQKEGFTPMVDGLLRRGLGEKGGETIQKGSQEWDELNEEYQTKIVEALQRNAEEDNLVKTGKKKAPAYVRVPQNPIIEHANWEKGVGSKVSLDALSENKASASLDKMEESSSTEGGIRIEGGTEAITENAMPEDVVKEPGGEEAPISVETVAETTVDPTQARVETIRSLLAQATDPVEKEFYSAVLELTVAGDASAYNELLEELDDDQVDRWQEKIITSRKAISYSPTTVGAGGQDNRVYAGGDRQTQTSKGPTITESNAKDWGLDSNTPEDFLQAIGDKHPNPFYQLIGRALAHTGVFKNIKLKVTNDPTQPFAGYYQPSTDTIGINLAVNSTLGGPTNTGLHEGLHAALEAFVAAPEDTLTPEQLAIKKELEGLRERMGILLLGPTWETQVREMAAKNKFNDPAFRQYYALTNLSEFITETMTNEDFQRILVETPVEGRTGFRGFIDKALRAIGLKEAAPNSEFERAAAQIFAVTDAVVVPREGQTSPTRFSPALTKTVEKEWGYPISGGMEEVLSQMKERGVHKVLAKELLKFDWSRTPLKIAKIRGREWVGEYDPTSGVIKVDPRRMTKALFEQTVLHEAIHAVIHPKWITYTTSPESLSNKEVALFQEIERLYDRALDAFKTKAALSGVEEELPYGLTNAAEFITEMLTAPEFTKLMSTVSDPSRPKKNIVVRFFDAIKRMLGVKPGSVADSAIDALYDLTEEVRENTPIVLPYTLSPGEEAELQEELTRAVGAKGGALPDAGTVEPRIYYSPTVVTPQQDQTYLEAVKRGDMETAQMFFFNEYADKFRREYNTIPDFSSSAFKTNAHLTKEDIRAIQEQYDSVFDGGTNLEYHVGSGNGVVFNPYNTRDYLVGQFIGDVFAVSHFAPENKKSGVSLLLDLLHSSTPSVFAVPTNLANQLEKLGFKRSKIGIKQYFNGEYLDKEVLVNNAFNANDLKEVATFYASELWRNNQLQGNKDIFRLADPVTYDDQGNVIPLSQRFNEKTDDTRYSPALTEIAKTRKSQAFAEVRQGFDEAARNELAETYYPISEGGKAVTWAQGWVAEQVKIDAELYETEAYLNEDKLLTDDQKDAGFAALVAEFNLRAKAARAAGNFVEAEKWGKRAHIFKHNVAKARNAGQALRFIGMLTRMMTPDSVIRDLKSAMTERQKADLPEAAKALFPRVQAAFAAASKAGVQEENLNMALVKLEKELVKATNDATKNRGGATPASEAANSLSEALGKKLSQSYEDAAIRSIVMQVEKARKGPGTPKEKAHLELLYATFTHSVLSQVKKTPATVPHPKQTTTTRMAEALKVFYGDTSIQQGVLDGVKEKLIANGMPEADVDAFIQSVMGQPPITQAEVVRGLRESGITLRALVESHWVDQRGTIKSFADLLAQEAGLSRKDALILEAKVTAIVNDAMAGYRAKVLEDLKRTVATKDAKKALSKTEKLLKAANTGLLTEEDFYNSIAEQFDLPTYTQQLAAHLEAKADALQKIPRDRFDKDGKRIAIGEELRRKRAGQEILDIIKKSAGITNLETMEAYWYMSVLSGLGTQFTNLMGGALQNATEFAILTTFANGLNPVKKANLAYLMAKSAFQVLRAKTPQIKAAWFEGETVTGQKLEALANRNPLELIGKDAGVVKRLLSNSKWVGRAMSVSDTLNASLAEGIRVGQLLQMNPGLRPQVEAMLTPTPKARQEALARAIKEGYVVSPTASKPEARRQKIYQAQRVQEILNAAMEPSFHEETMAQGLFATYNHQPSKHTPFGILGNLINSGIVGMVNSSNPGIKVSGLALRHTLFPFVRIAANLADRNLDYFPSSFLTRNTKEKLSEIYGRPATDADVQAQAARARAGLVMLLGLFAMIVSRAGDEGEEHWFDINGAGPRDPQDRKQWALNNKAWTVKFGSVQIPFGNTPLMFIFGPMASVSDHLKYSPHKDTGFTDIAAAYLLGTISVYGDSTFLSSLQTVGKIMADSGSNETRGQLLTGLLVRPMTGLSPRIALDIENLFNPSKPDPRSVDDVGINKFVAAVAKDLPVVRSTGIAGQESLNMWGKPIDYRFGFLDRILRVESNRSIDQKVGKLQERGVFLPNPNPALLEIYQPNGKKEKLTRSQVYEYQKVYGRTMESLMKTNIDSILPLTDEQAEKRIATLTKEAKSEALRSIRR